MDHSALSEDVFRDEVDSRLAAQTPEAFSLPGLSEGILCCALASKAGTLVWGEAQFHSWVDPTALDRDLIDKVRVDRPPALAHGFGRRGEPVLLIYASIKVAAHWPIKLDMSAAGKVSDSGVVIVALSLAHADDDLLQAAASFGMTKLEARVSAALVRLGALPEAAIHCRISYETAREAFAAARRKVGASRQADFIAILSRLVSNTHYSPEDAERVLVDLFSLSLRQAKLALLLTQGYTRAQAAKIANLTQARAKDDFTQIFDVLGIVHAAEIGRIVTEGLAATMLASNSNVELPLSSLKAAPLRFMSRADDQLIAVSDYGPKKGEPIFVLHSGTATRHIPRSLVARLQGAGFRPLSIDRPGFGLSDFGDPNLDPWQAAAADMKRVMDGFGIEKARFLTRGGNYAMLEFARQWPFHVDRVICLNPDVSTHHTHKRQGGIGVVWKASERFPERAEAVWRWIGSQATPSRIIQMLRMMIKSSPSDLRAFEAPDEVADFQRAVTMFATGRMSGTVREHRSHSMGVEAPPLEDASNWIVMMGGQDPMHDVADMERFWHPRLPGAAFVTIADGGRFLPLSHPNDVIKAILMS